MNTGLGDALKLAWKLGAVVRGGRRPPRQLRARADALRTKAGGDHGRRQPPSGGDDSLLARAVRKRVLPAVAATVSRLGLLSPALFRTISQTQITYRSSSLS